MLGVWAAAKERCVIVSQSTATLDVVAGLCAALSLRCARLDGGTEVSKRQDVVEAFNSHGVGDVFLLSTAAGGAGLNLTGASRLVLFDSHWCEGCILGVRGVGGLAGPGGAACGLLI